VSRNANRKNTFPAHIPSDPASQLRNGRKLRPITKLEIQFTDNAMDERAETAYSGDISGIMINGIGPMPKAKQLTKSKVPMAEAMLT